jgi:acyl carrier protein
VAAEDRFGLVIADDDWSRFVTVRNVIVHIERAGVIAPI